MLQNIYFFIVFYSKTSYVCNEYKSKTLIQPYGFFLFVK